MDLREIQGTIDSLAQTFRRTPAASGQTFGRYTASELVARKEFSGCSEMAMIAQHVLAEQGVPTRILLTASVNTLKDLYQAREVRFLMGHQFLVYSQPGEPHWVIDPVHQTIMSVESVDRYAVIRCPECPTNGMMVFDSVATLPTPHYSSLDDLTMAITSLAEDERAHRELDSSCVKSGKAW